MPRRQKGEGRYWYDAKTQKHHWRLRKDGKEYHVADRDPRRARERFRDIVRALEDHINLEAGKQTFGEYVKQYLETAIRVKKSTAQDYARRASYYILPWLKKYPLDSLTTRIGEAWVAALQQEEYAHSTIVQSLRLAVRILDRAAFERLISHNPFSAIQPPRIERVLTDDDEEGERTFTPEQEAALLADARAHDKAHGGRAVGVYLIYLLAFRLGLRRGEILGLRRKDIDFDRRVIRIRQQVIKTDGGVEISRTLKSPAARRDLPLLEELATVLRPHLLRLGGGDEALLFAGKGGKARYPDAVTKQFRGACVRVGCVGFSLHDARHSAITRWRERHIDAETVAALAGHETPKVSLETYSAVSVERKRRALGE